MTLEQTPKLSIVIVNFNTKVLTDNCLKAIEKYPPNFSYEVILVDNGSTDGSKEYFAAKSKDFKHLTFITNPINVGFAVGNNIGIRKSHGEYILLLNSDTEVKENAINKLVEFALEHDDAGAVGSKLLNTDGSVQASVFYFPTLVRAIIQFWFGGKSYLDKYAPEESKACEVEVLSMAAFLITPEARKKVGLLNEKYFMYFEDFDYCRKIREVGLKAYYLPASEVVHHHGASGRKLADDENQWRRLIPSSKIYHGLINHYILSFVLWSGQKIEKYFKK